MQKSTKVVDVTSGDIVLYLGVLTVSHARYSPFEIQGDKHFVFLTLNCKHTGR